MISEQTPVNLEPGVLPDGFCHKEWQDTYLQFIQATRAFLPGTFSSFIHSQTEPSANERNKLWYRTLNGIGNETFPLAFFKYSPAYEFAGDAVWILAEKHAIPPGTIQFYRSLTATSEALAKVEIEKLGKYPLPGSEVTLDTGLGFWALCDGDSIIGAGALAAPDLRGLYIVGAGAGSGTVSDNDYVQDDPVGSDSHLLTSDELPEHTHGVKEGTGDGGGTYGATGYGVFTPGAAGSNPSDVNVTAKEAHENRPKSIALWPMIKTYRLH